MTIKRPMLNRMIFKLHHAAGTSNSRCQEDEMAIRKKAPLCRCVASGAKKDEAEQTKARQK